jgi:hypothetical protein
MFYVSLSVINARFIGKQLNNLITSPDVVKPRGLRWAAYGEMKISYRILVRKLEGKRPVLRFKHVNEREIVDNEKYNVVMWTEFVFLRTGPEAGSCKHGNVP